MEKSFNKDLWRKIDSDFHCDLKEMKNAAIVAYYFGKKVGEDDYFSISPRSFFPFKKQYYDLRFNDATDAMKLAERLIKEWVASLFKPEEKKQLLNG